MKQTTRLDHEERIAEAVNYLLDHLDDPVDLRTLADKVGVSRFHFHRIFQALLGETVGEVLRRLRLERAAYHLRTTDTPIITLAFEAGYATHEAFIRAFRAAYGCTPSDLRRRLQYEGQLPTPSGIHYGHPFRIRFILMSGETKMQIETREIPTRKAVCLAHKGAYFMIGQTFDKLVSFLMEKGIPSGQSIALYYDDPEATPIDELRSDAGVLVADDFTTDDPDVRVVTVEGGPYAVGTHIGPYDGLGHSWGEIAGKYVPSSGYTFRNVPSFEIYVNNCNDVPPSELRTELYVPIEKAG